MNNRVCFAGEPLLSQIKRKFTRREDMAFGQKKLSRLSDEKLMELLQAGNSAAFEVLYERYSRRLLVYYFRMLGGDEAKAQDFLHDTFLKIIEKPRLFDTGKNFSGWLFTLAYNRCKNEYRRLEIRRAAVVENSFGALTAYPDQPAQPGGSDIDRQNFRRKLFAELQKLNPSQRSAFLLRYQENFTIRQIAETLDCSEGTVKSRLHYATRKLAKKLQQFNPNQVEAVNYEKIK